MHTRPVYALLQATKRESIRRQARDVAPPHAAHAWQRGALCYREHCAACHGAPGVAPQPFALGLQPVPPSLTGAARAWSLREIYWIVRHGIKMTGMPAWRYRMTDADLWSVAGFVSQLADWTPERWARQAAASGTARCERVDGDARPLRPADAERGRRAIPQHGCTACHVIAGVVGAPVHVGPPLAGFARRERLPGGLAATPDNLVRWLRDPAALDAHTAMPALGLDEQDAHDIAAYLRTLH
ncbi:MAG: c-type cytochrome [Burkholderiaceae bacterium]|nr:c-type cytochrome [Burkholderiaceae bacterium]